MVELMITTVILLFAVTGISQLLTANMSLRRSNRDTEIARNAALSVIERMKGMPFGEVFVSYNAAAEDDPGGPGSAPGASFEVRGLTPLRGDADGMCGRIVFPGDGIALREDHVDRDLGMPRDLDQDGAFDALDHAADAVVLPLRVRVEWQSLGNERFIEFVTTLSSPE